MEHIKSKNNLGSKLQMYSICSGKIRSRNEDIFEKLTASRASLVECDIDRSTAMCASIQATISAKFYSVKFDGS